MLLQRLVACDTSNPPGREAAAATVLEEYLTPAGVRSERVSKEPARPNLLATLPGRGTGPSLAFLGHLDVVPVRRRDWSVDPFGAQEKEGVIWGRGTIDMKCQVAATAVALATLAREGFVPNGDLMLILTADEEVGDAGVGAAHLVKARPTLCPDYVLGEGAGERFATANGPIYLLDRGVKATAPATLTVRGRAADSSLPGTGTNAIVEAARLLVRLHEHRFPRRLRPELAPLLDALADPGPDTDARIEQARQAHPGLREIVEALTRTVVRPTVMEAQGPANVVPEQAVVTLQCVLVPGTSKDELEAELRDAFGPGNYDLVIDPPQGGSISKLDTPLHRAIADFLSEYDPDATLVPALGYGFSDCHFMREAYGAAAYGFIPFRSADPMTNLTGKHAVDEHVAVDDVLFQTEAALAIARSVGSLAAV